jgi:hypothetical protein
MWCADFGIAFVGRSVYYNGLYILSFPTIFLSSSRDPIFSNPCPCSEPCRRGSRMSVVVPLQN